jgi:hypothetical protein
MRLQQLQQLFAKKRKWQYSGEEGMGARTLTLAMRRGSAEVSDGLRSPEPAILVLEISWMSEEREDLEEEEDRKKLETEPEPLCQRHTGVDGRKTI